MAQTSTAFDLNFADSTFARTAKLLNPDILLCGYPVERKDQVLKAINGSYGVFLVTDVTYDREESVTVRDWKTVLFAWIWTF